MADQAKPSGPDLSKGVPLDTIPDGGMVVGHVGQDEVLVARRGEEVFAIDAHCSHYHGPLGEGLMVGDTVRCPWHHACFDLKTGEATRAPAIAPLSCWKVERKGVSVIVRARKESEPRPRGKIAGAPEKIVIIGGGAAGFAAAEMLRRQKYEGSIVMLSADDAEPVDRPNLSKDYLAGSAPEDWVPMRPKTYYGEMKIDLRLRSQVTAIDRTARELALANGDKVTYDKLLLATGAEPIRLPIPGFDAPVVHTLRSLDDCRKIIAAARDARRVVVLGASFIGLEVAASLRQRELEVHVVAPEKQPLERVFGPELGAFIRKLHEEKGVQFHLDDGAVAIEAKRVRLKSGAVIEAADLVVAGVGVRPRVELAEKAGLTIDRGVKVDAYLQTSDPNIYAAGDIARWPDPHSGADIRVEHWVVAERQGQTAALNMLGIKDKFEQVPFFWSQHYDVPINYVGHAEGWDEIAVDGDIGKKDCVVRFKQAGRTLAVASIYRDVESLAAELEMEMERA